jgi:hypothetical protein
MAACENLTAASSLVVQTTCVPSLLQVASKLAWAAGLQTRRGSLDSPLVQYVQKRFCANGHVVLFAFAWMFSSQSTNVAVAGVAEAAGRPGLRCLRGAEGC